MDCLRNAPAPAPRSSRRQRCRPPQASARWALLLTLGGPVAHAAGGEEDPYCARVRDRAQGDAALLFAPTIQGQVIRFPSTGNADATGLTSGQANGYQLRAGVALSATDIYKGVRVLRAAELDCQQHQAMEQSQQLLLVGDDVGRLAAVEQELAYLEEKRQAWSGIAARSDERAARHLSSQLEAQAVHSRVAALERRQLQVAQELERLAGRGEPDADAAPGPLSRQVEDRGARFEHEASHIRTLDAWSLTLTGGLIPGGATVDAFGVLQLNFNLGGIVRYSRESRYLKDRATELHQARYELPARLRLLERHAQHSLELARRELAIVEGELREADRTRATLAAADSHEAPQALALAELDIIALEADRTYLEALIAGLARVAPPKAPAGPELRDRERPTSTP